MVKNFVILFQGIIIGVLALTILIMSFIYYTVRDDRDACVDFQVDAFIACEWECNECIDNYADNYDFEGDGWGLGRQDVNNKEKL